MKYIPDRWRDKAYTAYIHDNFLHLINKNEYYLVSL